MIPTAITTSLFAEGANDEAQLKNHVRRSLKMVGLLLIPAVIIVWFLANKFLQLFGGLYAENSATLLRWLAIAAFPLAINLFYFNIKRVQKKVKTVIFLAALMAIIVVMTSYLLLPRLGINGVGIAWLAGQSAVAVIVIVWDMRKWV
jgi:O-antigen/teichoic acid export membrane protein